MIDFRGPGREPLRARGGGFPARPGEERESVCVRAGQIASLLLAGVLGAVSATVSMISTHFPVLHDRFHKSSVTVEAVMMVAVFGLIFLAILYPLGASIDRALGRLRRRIEDSAHGDAASGTISGPQWLHPIVGAFAAAIEHYREERHRLRDELQEAKSRHETVESHHRHSEAVLHTLRDAVIVTDAADRVVMANEAALELFDLDMTSTVHPALDEAISSPRLCELIRDVRVRAEIGGLRHEQISIRPPCRDASETAGAPAIVFDACFMCVEQAKNEVGGVVAILHDLTQERELRELKSDFVSKASHELRTPLSSIRAYVEMLIDGEAKNDRSRQEFYHVIHEEAERLGRLIDNLLNISRIEAGMVQIDRRKARVGPLVTRAVTAVRNAAAEKRITVEQRLDPGDLHLEADRDMIYQVILNLLTNAVKYTPEGGAIAVAAEADAAANCVRISVTDTGRGIPEAAQSRVFEKFYRIDDFDTSGRGTGLGLTLCRHIVETLHEGRIGLDSTPGEGSRFWFTIPIRPEGARTAA